MAVKSGFKVAEAARGALMAGASIAERARAIENACRTALELLEDSKDREARLRHIDPLPASTCAIIRRLAASGQPKALRPQLKLRAAIHAGDDLARER